MNAELENLSESGAVKIRVRLSLISSARATSYVYHILQGVYRSVSLSSLVPYLSAVSCGVYDPELSVSCLWAQFALLKIRLALTSIKSTDGVRVHSYLQKLQKKWRGARVANGMNLAKVA